MKGVGKILQVLLLLSIIGALAACGEGADAAETNADELFNSEEDDLVAGASRQNFILSELCCGDSVVNPFESMELEVWLKDNEDNPGSHEGVFFEIVDLEPYDSKQEAFIEPHLSSRRVTANSQGVAKVAVFVGDFMGKITIKAQSSQADDLLLKVHTAAAPELPLLSNVQGEEDPDNSSCKYPKAIDKAKNHIKDEIFINLSDIDLSEGLLISSMVENRLPKAANEEDELAIQKVVVLFPPELNTFVLPTGGLRSFTDSDGEMVSLTSTFRNPISLKRGRTRVIQSPLISSRQDADLFGRFFGEEFEDKILSFMAMVYVEAITPWGVPLTSVAAPLLIEMCVDCDEPSTTECR